VQYSSSVALNVPRGRVVPFVADLSRYTAWMPLVHAVQAVGPDVWSVELRAKVGVFARSKRLTMKRTTNTDSLVIFERYESDNRQHAPWVMKVSLSESNDGCVVDIDLSYGGNLWTAGVLDKILAHQVDLGKKALAELVAHSS
jgi:carbon monoxide dehydrogenase subunit G